MRPARSPGRLHADRPRPLSRLDRARDRRSPVSEKLAVADALTLAVALTVAVGLAVTVAVAVAVALPEFAAGGDLALFAELVFDDAFAVVSYRFSTHNHVILP